MKDLCFEGSTWNPHVVNKVDGGTVKLKFSERQGLTQDRIETLHERLAKKIY